MYTPATVKISLQKPTVVNRARQMTTLKTVTTVPATTTTATRVGKGSQEFFASQMHFVPLN